MFIEWDIDECSCWAVSAVYSPQEFQHVAMDGFEAFTWAGVNDVPCKFVGGPGGLFGNVDEGCWV